MTTVQTVIVIIKFKSEVDVSAFRRPAPPGLFGSRRQSMGVNIMETQTIPLDRPIIIIPNGEADSVEIIPITDQTLIHGKNIKRLLK